MGKSAGECLTLFQFLKLSVKINNYSMGINKTYTMLSIETIQATTAGQPHCCKTP